VLAGLAFVVVIMTATDALMHATGVFPSFGQAMAGSLFLLALAYRTIYGLAGGYIAARFAPQNPIRHAVVLGLIGFVLGIAGTLATWNRGPEFGPKWYTIAVIIIAIPSLWLGGKLQRAYGEE
jgi:surface polysaccharide O-acyltransferase-like enzyme